MLNLARNLFGAFGAAVAFLEMTFGIGTVSAGFGSKVALVIIWYSEFTRSLSGWFGIPESLISYLLLGFFFLLTLFGWIQTIGKASDRSLDWPRTLRLLGVGVIVWPLMLPVMFALTFAGPVIRQALKTRSPNQSKLSHRHDTPENEEILLKMINQSREFWILVLYIGISYLALFIVTNVTFT